MSATVTTDCKHKNPAKHYTGKVSDEKHGTVYWIGCTVCGKSVLGYYEDGTYQCFALIKGEAVLVENPYPEEKA